MKAKAIESLRKSNAQTSRPEPAVRNPKPQIFIRDDNDGGNLVITPNRGPKRNPKVGVYWLFLLFLGFYALQSETLKKKPAKELCSGY